MAEKLLHADITKEILGAAFAVHRTLGPGFLESIYEEAMACELDHRGMPYQRQLQVPVRYREKIIGTHRLDLLVADKVIVELKAIQELTEIHKAIAVSYLSATGLQVALVLNFADFGLRYKRVAR